MTEPGELPGWQATVQGPGTHPWAERITHDDGRWSKSESDAKLALRGRVVRALEEAEKHVEEDRAFLAKHWPERPRVLTCGVGTLKLAKGSYSTPPCTYDLERTSVMTVTGSDVFQLDFTNLQSKRTIGCERGDMPTCEIRLKLRFDRQPNQ